MGKPITEKAQLKKELEEAKVQLEQLHRKNWQNNPFIPHFFDGF